MSNTAIRPKSITKRPHNETREMMLEWGGLSRVDGSARFAFGSSGAIASVSGPIEVRLNAELPSRATLEVHFQPIAGVPGTSEKRLSTSIRAVFEQLLILSAHPRTLIQLVVQCLAPTANPSSLAACLNAASLAMLHASSVPMRATLCAVSLGRNSAGELVLDPEGECSCWGVYAFGFGAKMREEGVEPLWIETCGLAEQELPVAQALATDGARQVMASFRTEISKRTLGAVVPKSNSMDLSS